MAAPVSPRPRGYRLRIGSARTPVVSVVKVPHLSLMSLLVSSSAPGLAGRTAGEVRAAVGRPGRFALAAVLQRSPHVVPDLAQCPIPPVCDVSAAEQAQRLSDISAAALPVDLARNFGGELPPWWRPAADRPRRWLDSFAAASLDGWRVIEPLWRRSQPLIDRETRRVGAAVVRGGLDALLNSLHPRIRCRDGELIVLDPRDSVRDLADRRLVLVPMICGPNGTVMSFDLPEVAFVGYPVRGFAESRGHRPRWLDPSGDALSLVLGPARARALRAANRPLTMGRLAAKLQCEPGTASYHCDRLETAGLIVRERRGQSVWVTRTARGDELADLLSG
jgi:DNA-binding transcriptional ArsR family regulator